MEAPGFSVSVVGKCGVKLIFDALRRINLSLSIGEVSQTICDEFSTDYIIQQVQAAREDGGPYKDCKLTESCMMLNDLGYRHLFCRYAEIERENAVSKFKQRCQING